MFMVIYREVSLLIILMDTVRAPDKSRIITMALQEWYVLHKIHTDTEQ
jgi:hypothetical protein